MIRCRLLAAGVVVGIVTAGMTPAQAAPNRTRRQLDAVFSRFGPNGPGVAVGIYARGSLRYARGFGSADLDHGVPVTARTVFNLASLTKQFTAFSIALLAREGKLALDADIRTYLPDLPDVGRVTVSDLVHHTSGVRDYLVLAGLGGRGDADSLTQAQALALIRRQRALSFPPGTRFDYSNSNYVLLAEIVKKVSRESLREFMRKRIFVPLGMTVTRLHDDLGLVERDLATGYLQRESGGWARAIYNHETVGAGNLLSTVGDLAKWAGNFAHPTVGDRAFIERLSAPVALRDGTAVNYGFGLGRGTLLGHPVVRHNGEVAGFASTFLFFPDDDFAIVLLFNHQANPDLYAEKIARIFLKSLPEISDPPPAPEAPSLVVPARGPTPPDLASLAGVYYSDEADTTFDVVIEAGGPTLGAPHLPTRQPLPSVAPDRFAVDAGPLRGLVVGVERAADGRARALTFDLYGVRGLRFVRRACPR